MTIPSIASVASSLLAVGLSVGLLISSNHTQTLARELQKQAAELQNQQQAVQAQQQIAQIEQQDVQRVNAYQQLVPTVVNDLRTLMVKEKDGGIRDLLTKFKIPTDVPAEAKPADTKPAATPAP